MRKVGFGQRAKFNPNALNSILDAAQDFRNRQQDGGSGAVVGGIEAGIIRVASTSEDTLDAFSVVGIDALLTIPGDADNWKSYILNQVDAAAGSGFAILQESIPPGMTGRAMIVGVTPVQLSRLDGDTSMNAGVVDGATYLTSGIDGALILWEEDVDDPTTQHTALVMIPQATGDLTQTVTIQSVQADYLTCEDADGNTVYVAKPTRLRSTDTAARAVANQTYTVTKSAFSGDGQSCTATRSSDSATENLGVDDLYIADDEIIALPCPDTGLTDPDDNDIVLIDANVDARHWAAKASS